ncbi:MAG: F-type H+-transporting ATPase subunit b [Myxococcota bacterium]|jgi:F-type H+-transporting ATPase subunit b
MIALLSGGHGPSFNIEGFYAINFLVFVGFLVWKLKGPLAAFLTGRRDRMTKDIQEARQMREEAEAKLAEYDKRLGSLESEIQGILDDARAQGETERERIVAEATQAAERLRTEAKTRIEQETRKLQLELRRKMVDLSVEVAERIITEKITDTHRRRMVTEYIGDLENREGQL